MTPSLTIEQIAGRLEEFASGLAAGSHQELERKAAALLAPGTAALEQLLQVARDGKLSPDAAVQCRDIRRRLGSIREMLAHAQGICAGLTGIVGLIYEAEAGARYSHTGAPAFPSIPRLRAEV